MDIKNYFNSGFVKNDFIHYLVYAKLKGKSIYCCCGAGRRGFNKYFQKIKRVLKIIENKEKYYFYLKTRFPSVDWFIICQVLKSIEKEIKGC